MKNTKLSSMSLLRDDAVGHTFCTYLLGVLVVCGCNKTPPADNTASSTPAAAPAATTAPTPDQTRALLRPRPPVLQYRLRPRRRRLLRLRPRLRLHHLLLQRCTPYPAVQHLPSESLRI